MQLAVRTLLALLVALVKLGLAGDIATVSTYGTHEWVPIINLEPKLLKGMIVANNKYIHRCFRLI